MESLNISKNALSHKLGKNNYDVIVCACEKTEDQRLRCDFYYMANNYQTGYRPGLVIAKALYENEKAPLYENEKGNMTPRTFLTGETYRKMVFLNKHCEKIASDFFGDTDVRAKILEMESRLLEKRQQKKAEKEKRAFENMEFMFRKPAWPEDKIKERGRELIIKYAIRRDNGKSLCTCCETDVEIHANHRKSTVCPNCGATVTVIDPKRLKYKLINDSIWIYVPRIGCGSYYLYLQTVDTEKYAVDVRFSECARYICKKTKREYWTDHYGSWEHGKSDYFTRFSFGSWRESSSWCERSYVVPDQYKAFLHKLDPKTKKIPFDKFFINDQMYFWYEEQALLVKNLSDEAARRIRQLVRNGLPMIADTYSVMNEFERKEYFSVGESRLQRFLRLTRGAMKDLKAINGTVQDLKKIRGKIGQEYCSQAYRFSIPNIDVKLYVNDALKRSQEGNANFVYHIPVWNDKEIRKLYLDISVGGNHTVCWSLEDTNGDYYKKIGAHWYKQYSNKSESSIYPAVILSQDFRSFLNVSGLAGKLPEEMMRSMKTRINLLGNKYLFSRAGVLLFEKLDHAGFKQLAKEIIRHEEGKNTYEMRETQNVINPMMERVDQKKLFRVMGVTAKVFSALDRKNLSFRKLKEIQDILALNPEMDYSQIVRYIPVMELDRNARVLRINRQPINETLEYIEAHKRIHPHEYFDYIEHMQALGIVITRKRAFPEDFESAQMETSSMYKAFLTEAQAKTMKKLHDALVAQAPFMDFMKRNKKYLVFVPESPEELIREGERLHNCLRTYVDEVSNGNTSVFFIREANKPDNAFVAMEYRNERLIQIHSDFNEDVDPEVEKFANGFIRVLKKIGYEPKTWLASEAA